mgnify:FL=1
MLGKNKEKHDFCRGGGKIVYVVLALLLMNNIILQVRVNYIVKDNTDEIQNARILSLEETKESDCPILHFSIDDVIEIFKDLTKHADSYDSIFDNGTLCYLKELHEKYGMKLTLYCFYEFAGFNLSECTDKFADEFLENRDWLKFGFHAYNAESYTNMDVTRMRDEYMLLAEELHRITGLEKENLAKTLRLDRFAGTQQQLAMLEQEFGVTTFLTADDAERKSYCLDNDEQSFLYEQDHYMDGKISFTPTDIRLESLDGLEDLEDILYNHKDEKYLVVFTHEHKLNGKVKKMIHEVGKYGVKNQYTFSDEIF